MSVQCILVAGPPKRKVDGYQQRHDVKLGGTLRLVCPVEADSTLLVEWTKDEQRINMGWDDRYRLVSSSSLPSSSSGANHTAAGSSNSPTRSSSAAVVDTLRVRDVTSSDAGQFKCFATNGFGTVIVTFNVRVRCT
jgi:hypothetical protein